MQPTHDDGREKFNEMLKGYKIAMLTTVHEGQLRSRPMAIQEREFDGDLWFFTNLDGGKVCDIQDEQEVNVSYMDQGGNSFLSACGKATIIRDVAKQKELWNPMVKAWFDGPEDPNLALLKVEVEGAEYWDGPHSKVLELFAIAKAALTGQEYEAGDHAKVRL